MTKTTVMRLPIIHYMYVPGIQYVEHVTLNFDLLTAKVTWWV